MKILLASIAVCYFCLGVNAQDVISTTGKYAETGSGSLSWSVGEPIVETVSDGSNTLTQGFHQSKLTVTTIYDKEIIGIEIKVYPNPTSNYLSVEVNSEKQKELLLSLFDMSGKLISQEKMTSSKQTVSMKEYAPATYLLKVTENNKELKTYQIVKQ